VPRDENSQLPLLVDLPPIPVRRVKAAAGSKQWTYRPDALQPARKTARRVRIAALY
jgi:hypothetical protein